MTILLFHPCLIFISRAGSLEITCTFIHGGLLDDLGATLTVYDP